VGLEDRECEVVEGPGPLGVLRKCSFCGS